METISNDNKPIYYLMSSYFFVRSFTPVHTLYYFPFSYLYEKLSWFDQITWPTLAGKIYMGLGGILFINALIRKIGLVNLSSDQTNLVQSPMWCILFLIIWGLWWEKLDRLIYLMMRNPFHCSEIFTTSHKSQCIDIL